MNPHYLCSLCTSSATRESQIPGCVSSARKMASRSASAASGLPLLVSPFSFNCNKDSFYITVAVNMINILAVLSDKINASEHTVDLIQYDQLSCFFSTIVIP